MDYNPGIFKAYDIRGLVGKDFDLEFCERLGRAFVVHTKAKVLVLGRDMRGTSPEYLAAVAEGAMKQGADVVDIGMVSTPMFYFAVANYDLHDAGIMVTASHNPAEYNGFKPVWGDALPIGRDSGGLELEKLIVADRWPDARRGTLIETDIKEDYLAQLWSLVPPATIGKSIVVADAANGMSGVILPDIFRELPGVTVHPLFWEPDGTFPNHEANPLKEETLDDLKRKMQQVRADVGFAFDGDSDRIGLVDETGRTVGAYEILGILSKILLQKYPGKAVTCDIRCSNAIVEAIEEMGSKSVMTPVGHALIKPYVREHDAIIGGELSGHFYFGQFGGAENSDYVMLLVLQALTQTGRKLSELAAPYRRYHASGELNFEVADKQGMMARILEASKPGATAASELDGIRLDFEDGSWFGVRASNTEPLLRLNVEAKTKDRMASLRDEIVDFITKG